MNLIQDSDMFKNTKVTVYDLPNTVNTWQREFYHGEKSVKPLFVEDALRRMKEGGGRNRIGSMESFPKMTCRYMFYMDASIRMTRALDKVAIDTTNKKGILISPQLHNPQIKYVHPNMYKWFGFNYEAEKALCKDVTSNITMMVSQCMPQTHSGVFLLDTWNQTIVNKVMIPWFRCAKFKLCSVPEGAFSHVTEEMRKRSPPSRPLYTHRSDQGSYSFLLDPIVGRGLAYMKFQQPVKVIDYVYINRTGKEVSVTDIIKQNKIKPKCS